MNEHELRERLNATSSEPDRAVEDRAWQIVRDAYQPGTASMRRRRRRVTAPAIACLIAIAVIGLMTVSAPRQALARWLRTAIGLTAQPATRPMLAGLPGGGQMLVNSPIGPWIVHRDGRRRYLGRYTAASWSPHSLFVVAWRGSKLAALDPVGRPRWTLTAPDRVTVARWSPDGYRIAYLAGRSLWIVAGDGSDGHRLPVTARAPAPAWQPHLDAGHRVAFVDGPGDVELRDADTGALLWRARTATPPEQLLWSSDGSLLVAVGAGRVTLYDGHGRLVATRAIPAGETAGDAVFAPSGDRLALVLQNATSPASSIDLLAATPAGLSAASRPVFSARERISGLSWSPNGQWLLASAPSADQWIFIRTVSPTRLAAVSEITSKFDPGAAAPLAFPTLGGWQG